MERDWSAFAAGCKAARLQEEARRRDAGGPEATVLPPVRRLTAEELDAERRACFPGNTRRKDRQPCPPEPPDPEPAAD